MTELEALANMWRIYRYLDDMMLRQRNAAKRLQYRDARQLIQDVCVRMEQDWRAKQ